MKRMKLTTLLSAIFIVIGFSSNAQEAIDILKKVDGVMYSSLDMTAKTKIILIDKKGKEKVREATTIQKGMDKRIFRFTAPSSQAGIAVLSLPDDIMYLYMPAFGKERRISSSVKKQNFAGTDFSYDDMESVLLTKKYTAILLSKDGDYYLLELKPKSKKSNYSKLIMKVDKANYFPASMEFYDRGGKKAKEATSKFVKIGKYWNAEEMIMKDLKKNHTTKMIMSDVVYDQGLSDDEFSVRKLKQ